MLNTLVEELKPTLKENIVLMLEDKLAGTHFRSIISLDNIPISMVVNKQITALCESIDTFTIEPMYSNSTLSVICQTLRTAGLDNFSRINTILERDCYYKDARMLLVFTDRK